MKRSGELFQEKINANRKFTFFVVVVFLLFLMYLLTGYILNKMYEPAEFFFEETPLTIKLPPPVLKGEISVEEALGQRRSFRNYSDDLLSLEDAGQLLWAAQGITSDDGGRTSPSAGALYPLKIYLTSGTIADIPEGAYRYLPEDHSIEQIVSGDLIQEFYFASRLQRSLIRPPGIIIITAVYSKTVSKYGSRGERYVHMEAGHVAQNICLQSVSLGIGTVTVGSFRDSVVHDILNLQYNEIPLYLMPIGKVNYE